MSSNVPDKCHMPGQMDSYLCTIHFQQGLVLGAVTPNLKLSGMERPRDTIILANSHLTDEKTETQRLSNLPKVTELICRGA